MSLQKAFNSNYFQAILISCPYPFKSILMFGIFKAKSAKIPFSE
jgi:hypothetical protein